MLSKKQLKKLTPQCIKIKLDETGRMSSASEILVQNLLISTELDFNLCSQLTGLDIGKLVEIYIKYEVYIDKILKNMESSDKDNIGIEKAINLLLGHIEEMEKIHGTDKALRGSELANLCKILDRLIAIKNAKISEFDKITSTMISMTVKQKTLEKIEFGELQLDMDSNYNFTTLADKLEQLASKTNLGGKGTKKNIYVYNVAEETTVKEDSIISAMKIIGIGSNVFYQYLDSGEEYKGFKWYTEEKFKEITNGE